MSHVLQTGFITKGAASQALRYLGNRSLRDRVHFTLTMLEGRPSGEVTEIRTEDQCGLRFWISNTNLYYVRIDGAALLLHKWLAYCCHGANLWETPCVLWARGGSTGQTTFKIAMAILGIELVPGGSNLSPILIDQASDGEFR